MMKTPPFELLETLIAVAESKNFEEAAKRLGITQPSVSYKMMELERSSKSPVFELLGKKKVLTHYGRSLYEMARKEVENLEQSFEELSRRYLEAKNLTLKIGGRSELLEWVIPQLEFEGKFQVTNLSSQKALVELVEHKLDIAITHMLPDSNEFFAKKLFQSESRIIIHQKFLKNKKLNLELLKNKDFLTKTPCLIYYEEAHILQEWLSYVGLSLNECNVKIISDDWRSIKAMVENGLGYAFTPDYIDSNLKEVQSLAIGSSTLKKYSFYMVYGKNLKQIEAFKDVLNPKIQLE